MNTHPSNHYCLVRKLAVPHGIDSDQHNLNLTQVTKFGRRIVKTFAYRAKTLRPVVKGTETENPKNGSVVSNSIMEHAAGSTWLAQKTLLRNLRHKRK